MYIEFKAREKKQARFYNTTKESGETLEENKTTASRQTDEVLDVFKRHPHSKFTVYMIWEMLGQKMLKTSVGRSITTLTKEGLLLKTDEKKTERFGRSNYLYTLNPNQ